MSNEQLTEREQRVLGHLRRAQELKQGLARYAREAGIAVSEIYSGKQALGSGSCASVVRACIEDAERIESEWQGSGGHGHRGRDVHASLQSSTKRTFVCPL